MEGMMAMLDAGPSYKLHHAFLCDKVKKEANIEKHVTSIPSTVDLLYYLLRII